MSLVVPFMGHPLCRDLFPDLLARVPVEAEYEELVKVPGWLGLYFEHRVGLGQLSRLGDAVGLHGSQHKHALAPDNRRRTSFTSQFDLPFDVGLLVPFDWRVSIAGGPVGIWPAPVVPIG